MNRLSSLLCAAAIIGVSMAFSPIANTHHRNAPSSIINKSSTSLNSIIFEPPPDDNCEVDGSDCEESVFDRKRREKMDADSALTERAVQHGYSLSDVDFQESIDQYQNAPTGGNLIPGISLSALCGDD